MNTSPQEILREKFELADNFKMHGADPSCFFNSTIQGDAIVLAENDQSGYFVAVKLREDAPIKLANGTDYLILFGEKQNDDPVEVTQLPPAVIYMDDCWEVHEGSIYDRLNQEALTESQIDRVCSWLGATSVAYSAPRWLESPHIIEEIYTTINERGF